MKMVQSLDQYVFIHDAILEVIMCGDTQIDAGDYMQKLRKYKTSPNVHLNEFDNQFNVRSQWWSPAIYFLSVYRHYPRSIFAVEVGPHCRFFSRGFSEQALALHCRISQWGFIVTIILSSVIYYRTGSSY
jgi:hypothetical protein